MLPLCLGPLPSWHHLCLAMTLLPNKRMGVSCPLCPAICFKTLGTLKVGSGSDVPSNRRHISSGPTLQTSIAQGGLQTASQTVLLVSTSAYCCEAAVEIIITRPSYAKSAPRVSWKTALAPTTGPGGFLASRLTSGPYGPAAGIHATVQEKCVANSRAGGAGLWTLEVM